MDCLPSGAFSSSWHDRVRVIVHQGVSQDPLLIVVAADVGQVVNDVVQQVRCMQQVIML